MSVPEPSLAPYKVAAIQFDPLLGEKDNNISRLLRLTEEAAQHGARLIVHPELATTGYCWLSREEVAPYVEPVPGPTTDRFAQLAAHYDCYIATSLPEVDPTTNVYYNCMALIGPAGLIGVYRKIHSYISEPRWARDGDLGFPVWDTPLGRLSGVICMDAEFFEATRIPALHGADVLLFPTNWLEEKCPSNRWLARAFENGVYFIAANRCGLERTVQFSGGSCVLDPDGAIQAFLDNGEGIVYGEVDVARARDKRWGPLVKDSNGTAHLEVVGDRLADRRPAEYLTLVNNTYLWEPLMFHGLYEMGELPPGQLSCAGIIQNDLSAFKTYRHGTPLEMLTGMVRSTLRDHDFARPDVLVLPELILPGPLPSPMTADQSSAEAIAALQAGAIEIPGPETESLVELATEFQISLVLGVAERAFEDRTNAGGVGAREADARGADGMNRVPTYYNTVLLIDPEGVYGRYRKLHLTASDRLWANPGNLGLPVFDIPAGRVGLATGYDVLFPETLRVLAGKGADLVCAPAYLDFPEPVGLGPSSITYNISVAPEEYDATHSLIWRLRAAEHQVYLALANWSGEGEGLRANGYSGIFSPSTARYPWAEVIAENEPDVAYPPLPALAMMTIDTREQRTGRRSTAPISFAPGEVAGSLTGELAYDIRETIPGNVVRAKPLLRKRVPFWYLDLVRTNILRST